MRVVDIYKYNDSDGIVTITPIKRSQEDEPFGVRLIADEGMCLIKDDIVGVTIDTTSDEGWVEEYYDGFSEKDLKEALSILGVDVDE